MGSLRVVYVITFHSDDRYSYQKTVAFCHWRISRRSLPFGHYYRDNHLAGYKEVSNTYNTVYNRWNSSCLRGRMAVRSGVEIGLFESVSQSEALGDSLLIHSGAP